jgi:hypothetical protein
MLLLGGAMIAARAFRARQKAMTVVGFLQSGSPARMHRIWTRFARD